SLVDGRLNAHRVALPVAAGPGGLRRHDETSNRAELLVVAPRKLATPRDDRRQPLQLLAPDRRLDVSHPVVVADDRIVLEDHLRRAVTYGIGHAHAVLAKQAEGAVELRVVRRDHAAVAGRQQLARMKREAGDVAAGPPDWLPLALPRDLAADGARR